MKTIAWLMVVVGIVLLVSDAATIIVPLMSGPYESNPLAVILFSLGLGLFLRGVQILRDDDDGPPVEKT
jgi:predicted phage tail protein